MVVTDILTTWVEVIISVNWIVVFSLMFLVQFVWIDWSVLLWCYWLSDSSGMVQSWLVGIRLVCSFLWLRIVTIYHKYSHEKMFRLGSILNYNKILLFLNCHILSAIKVSMYINSFLINDNTCSKLSLTWNRFTWLP